MTTQPTKPLAKKPAKKAVDKGRYFAWVFVAVAVIGIVVMVVNAPKEHQLSCSGSSSLIGFGSCHEE